jgi:cell division septation protein DedD
MDPERDYGRVSLTVSASVSRRRHLLAGTIDVATTVSLDNATQMESAAASVNSNSLGTALNKYNMVLTGMSPVETKVDTSKTTTQAFRKTTSAAPTPTPSPSSSPDATMIGLAAGGGALLLALVAFWGFYRGCSSTGRKEDPRFGVKFMRVKVSPDTYTGSFVFI